VIRFHEHEILCRSPNPNVGEFLRRPMPHPRIDHYERMKLLWRFLLMAALTLLALPMQSNAQYMFLDSNGDGRHDHRDQVSRQGWSDVDVWLDLAANRDPAGRSTIAASQQALAAYELAIHGIATMEWGAFTPADPAMKVTRGPVLGTGTFYVAVDCSKVRRGPKHRLGRLRLRAASGNGDLEIWPCLAAGACLHILAEETRLMPQLSSVRTQ